LYEYLSEINEYLSEINVYCTKDGERAKPILSLCVVLCVVGNQIIAHAHCLRVFNRARDRVALSTVTALDAAQDDMREFW